MPLLYHLCCRLLGVYSTLKHLIVISALFYDRDHVIYKGDFQRSINIGHIEKTPICGVKLAYIYSSIHRLKHIDIAYMNKPPIHGVYL